MVELKNVSVTYSSGVDALHNVNLKINDGDFAFVVGASGAGKSTVAKRIAKDLSIIYVDTGAMYRCIGLYALRQGLDTKDSQQVSSCLEQIHLETSYDVQNGQRIFLNGEDVSEAIRTPDASMAASNVSAIPQVRAFLLDLQRDMAKKALSWMAEISVQWLSRTLSSKSS